MMTSYYTKPVLYYTIPVERGLEHLVVRVVSTELTVHFQVTVVTRRLHLRPFPCSLERHKTRYRPSGGKTICSFMGECRANAASPSSVDGTPKI